MKTITIAGLILISCALAGTARAVPDGFIYLRVSVKFIVNPDDGRPPVGTDDANLRQCFDHMNRWLANTFRGYRLRLVDLDSNAKFLRIGAKDDMTGPAKWYNSDLKKDAAARSAFETAAKGSPSLYGWNSGAINIYVNNNDFSSASFPSSGNALVQTGYSLIASDSPLEYYKTNNYKIAANLLHEVGHFFELYHTWGGASGDGISDTAPDLFEGGGRVESTVRNQIAQLTWGVNYSGLTPENKTLVDNTANNAMSYYQLFYDDPAQGKVLTDAERFGPARFVFTELQMDKWATNANGPRSSVTSGTMRFVSTGGWDTLADSQNPGLYSHLPLRTVAVAAARAASGPGDDEILLLAPGSYGENLTISTPCSLRATRRGAAVIGNP